MTKPKFIPVEYVGNEGSKIYNINLEWKRLFRYLQENTCAGDFSRPIMTGIKIEKKRMIATNGYVISVVTFEDDIPFPEGIWRITFLGKDFARFELIDGNFPEWEAIFNPLDLEKNVYIDLDTKEAKKIKAFFFGGVTSYLLAKLLDTKMDHNHNAVGIYAGKGVYRFDLGEDNYNDLGTIHIYGCLMPQLSHEYKDFVHNGTGIIWKDAA